MRHYVPEPTKFRFFLQKPECQKLTEPAPVDMDRAAPKGADDVRREQEVKKTVGKEPLHPNASAHRVLDHLAALHKWWTTAPLPQQAPAPKTAGAAATAAQPKPFEPLDLQDVPDARERSGYKIEPALMRQWFSNPAYAAQSPDQRLCLYGASL